MNNRKKKVTITWLKKGTAPTPFRRRENSSVTPSSRNKLPNEDSKSLPLSDSPGLGGLETLSLDTPKRKATDDDGSSEGRIKLRKLSRRKFETLNSSVSLSIFIFYICSIFPLKTGFVFLVHRCLKLLMYLPGQLSGKNR